MTAVRQLQDHVLESSDSSDSSSNNNNDGASANSTPLSLYKQGCLKYNDFVNKLDTYNNNQLLLPSQFYKTLLAKAVLSSSSDDKANVYKNMLFPKERDFEQVPSREGVNRTLREGFGTRENARRWLGSFSYNLGMLDLAIGPARKLQICSRMVQLNFKICVGV